ncbi:MAG: flavodoxin [Chloroflexi bacterium]|nr:MAG: flavodoxin [Chloroflexota bacterium]
MESLVVYDSQFGNTKKLAEAIADGLCGLGSVRLLGLDRPPPKDLGTVDLLIVGGPTQLRRMSARMREFLDLLETKTASGMVAVTFDTRYRVPAAFSGSAARLIARKLRRVGIPVFTRPESFFVSRRVPELEQGEAERAAGWARSLAASLALSHWCAT